MRVTPSLPQRGRQPKGSIPLTPLIIFSFYQKILVNYLVDITCMDAPETDQNKKYENHPDPPCLGEALRRVILINNNDFKERLLLLRTLFGGGISLIQ